MIREAENLVNPVKKAVSNPTGAAKEIAITIAKKGFFALGGLMLSRAIMPRFVQDNTLLSAVLKGAGAVGAVQFNGPFATGIALDAADDVWNIVAARLNLGGIGGGGAGGGQGQRGRMV